MKLKKALLILLSIYVLGLSFHGVCGMAWNWIIAANYDGYRFEKLVRIPGAMSSDPNDLFGKIGGDLVSLEVSAERMAQFRRHPQAEYEVVYNPSLPNMFFNGEYVRTILMLDWKPRRDFVSAACLQAGLALLFAAGFVVCLRAIRVLNVDHPAVRDFFAVRWVAPVMLALAGGSLVLCVVRLLY